MPDRASALIVHLSDLHLSEGNTGLEERNAHVRRRLCADLEGLIEQAGRPADAAPRFWISPQKPCG